MLAPQVCILMLRSMASKEKPGKMDGTLPTPFISPVRVCFFSITHVWIQNQNGWWWAASPSLRLNQNKTQLRNFLQCLAELGQKPIQPRPHWLLSPQPAHQTLRVGRATGEWK